MEPNRNDTQPTQDPADLWDHWVHTRPDGHPLQLSSWGALKTRFGWQSGRVVLPTPQGVPQAGAQVLLRRFYGLTLAYVPRGPLVDWTDAQLREELLEALRRHCARAGAALLKIEPDLPDSVANRALLHRCGFTPSPQSVQPPSTVLVDLRKDEAALLADMKSKWRYNIRLAERKGVTVRPLTRAELPTLHRLLKETGARDGFAVHSSDYYDTAFDLWVPDHATFLVAEVAGEPLGAIVVAQAGPVAVYLWGASSERQRSLMPNHALQWAGMRWARNRGATRYDLWGIPDEIGQLATRLAPTATIPAEALPLHLDSLPSQGLWGVYRFKQGFGGQVTRLVGAWDMPIDPVRSRLYTVGLKFQQLSHPATSRPVGALRSTAGQLIAVDSPAQWHAALAHTPAPHVLQSWEWGEIKAQTGWHAERLALAGGSAAFQLLWRTPLPPLRVGYVPKGPAVDWADPDAVEAALTAVEECARQLRCVFVKIDPDVREESPQGRRVLHALQRRGWRSSDDPIQFKNTATTDLRGGPETLLATLKSKWRYNLRLAEKRGITVRCGQPADLPEFYALYAETGARDGFLVRPASYYLTTWERFLRAQAEPHNPAGGVLLLATHPEEPGALAGLFLLRYGATTWYFYGASSGRRRRDMPNYLLQWEALCWAQRQGCTCYDWWGAPTHLDAPDDRLQGVWQFKQGFGATFQPHIGAWDYVFSTPAYQLVTAGKPFALALLRRLSSIGLSRRTPAQAESSSP